VRLGRWLVVLAVAFCGSCHETPPRGTVLRAEFGLFFGGQVQQLTEIPFEPDPAKQTLGFRVEFSTVVDKPLDLLWELDMPNTVPRRRSVGKKPPPARAVQSHHGQVLPGRRSFEQVVRLKPNPPLGTWNIRVRVGKQWLIDRPFLLYDAAARERANRAREPR
jgi:hypothetical protein